MVWLLNTNIRKFYTVMKIKGQINDFKKKEYNKMFVGPSLT